MAKCGFLGGPFGAAGRSQSVEFVPASWAPRSSSFTLTKKGTWPDRGGRAGPEGRKKRRVVWQITDRKDLEPVSPPCSAVGFPMSIGAQMILTADCPESRGPHGGAL